MRDVLRLLTLCLSTLSLLWGFSGLPAQADDNVASYSKGEQVEFRFGSSRPWQAGEVTKLYPAYNQVVVRDATGYEQAYSMENVRHLGAAETSPAPNPGAGPVARAQPAPTPQASAGQAWRTGDRVSVVVAGGCCYDGVVLRAGAGKWNGYYMIQFDDGSHQQYALARNVRPRGAGARQNSAGGHRAGCQIMTIGNKPVCVPR